MGMANSHFAHSLFRSIVSVIGFGFQTFGFVGHLYRPFARKPWLTVYRAHAGVECVVRKTLIFVRLQAATYVACRDGYSRSNIVHQPAANQVKWSSCKSARGGVVIRDYLWIPGTDID